MPRKVTLVTSATVKINTGNFESIDVSKTLTMEIEFEKSEELAAASARADNAVAALLKDEENVMLEYFARKRAVK